MDKVQGGTPRGFQSLCVTCRFAQNIRGLNLQEVTYCRAGGSHAIVITFPVERCSVFDDKSMPNRWEMEQIAWNVHSRNRGPMGFTDEGGAQIVVEPPGEAQHGIGIPQKGGG